MIHRLIVGGTLTGKTTIARKIAAQYEERGIVSTVYDPLSHDWPEGAIITTTPEDFFAVIHARNADGQRQLCITDEADTVFSQSDRDRFWIAVRGRHYGIENIFCTQRPTMIAPTVRTQCAELFCFRVSASDAAMLSQDFADERLREAVNLDQGEFLYSRWEGGKKVLDKFRAF